MAKEYKEVALSKESAKALMKALSADNVKIAGGGKATAKRATAKPKK
jgi:hypothetical protein